LLSPLLAAPDGQACGISPIASGCRSPRSAHHLKQLADAGLVIGERRGVWTDYRVNRDALATAGRLLAVEPVTSSASSP
jgi:ArsR family transcriptional regulator